tara:strand:+ start:289 stop:576 length:288 start_codon:yes stop_codon:yes gene_type:complete
MKEFNIGDEVWFFSTDCGRYVFVTEGTGIFPKYFNIEHGTIVGMNSKKDYVHVYIEGQQDTCCFGYCFHNECFFDSKNAAIQAMVKRLHELDSTL